MIFVSPAGALIPCLTFTTLVCYIAIIALSLFLMCYNAAGFFMGGDDNVVGGMKSPIWVSFLAAVTDKPLVKQVEGRPSLCVRWSVNVLCLNFQSNP